jgi:hypothetical protein
LKFTDRPIEPAKAPVSGKPAEPRAVDAGQQKCHARRNKHCANVYLAPIVPKYDFAEVIQMPHLKSLLIKYVINSYGAPFERRF